MFNRLVNIKENGDKIVIKAPYNAQFVKDLKGLIPSARWNGARWIINASGKNHLNQLLSKYYPADDGLQTVRIEWNLERGSPRIDGNELAFISRDWWRWRSDCPIDFQVIDQGLHAGGSRKNPGLFGGLVIEAAVRPGATISPEPENIEILEEGEFPNPLADFPTEDLLAELKRRGIEI